RLRPRGMPASSRSAGRLTERRGPAPTDAAAPAAQAGTMPPSPAPPVSEELRDHFAPLLRGTLIERCGIELLTLDAGGGTASMPVAGNTQPAGLLHGGATIALAETIASFAAQLRAR